MRNIKPGIWFLFSWLVINTYVGQWEKFPKPPQGMHQGAQIDRASVAWNYYAKSMNFFRPRVMENRAHEGVAGMEFPLVNYAVAALYKIFGPREWLYRLLMFLIATCGAYAAFSITGFFIQKTFTRLVLTFGWYLSPLLVFYSVSFIPDPVALAFCMISLFYFFQFYFNIKIQQSKYLYLLFTTLAGLIKITFLISHFAIATLFILYRFKPVLFTNGFPNLLKAWLYLIIPLMPVTAWYAYARHLTNQTLNVHFLQKINPANSIAEFADNTRFSFVNWQSSIYSENIIYFILALFLIVFIIRFNRKLFSFPGMFAALLLIGFIASFLLFNFQYRYHDYYYHLLFPALFFMLLYLQQIFIEQKNVIIGLIPMALLLGFYLLPFNNARHVKKMLTARYEEGNYYCQEVFAGIRKYEHLADTMNKYIPASASIASVFDPTPNSTLYFMRRQGVRIAPDFDRELTNGILEKHKVQYLIINDSVKWDPLQRDDSAHSEIILYNKDGISIRKRN